MPRRTSHRIHVDRLLARASGPLSAQEVHQALLDTGIGIATVYRLLKLGVREKRFAVVELPQGPHRFEPVERSHHPHFECLACHRVYDAPGYSRGLEELIPDGFVLDSHDLLLRGICVACKEDVAA